MSEFFAALRQFLLGLRPWVVVAPWEQALRVRAGKHVQLLGSGFHVKLPVLDMMYLQTVRLRVCNFGYGRQTVTTKDGVTVTFSGAIGYGILDLEKLYRTLHHAEDTLQSLARGMIAEYVNTHFAEACAPARITKRVGADLARRFKQYGLDQVCLYLTDYAVVRTYRIIGDNGPYGSGSSLDTSTPLTRMTG